MGLAAQSGRPAPARPPRPVPLAAGLGAPQEGSEVFMAAGRSRPAVKAADIAERALHAGSSSPNTLTSATASEPSAISAAQVERRIASALGVAFSRGMRTKRLN